MLASVNDAPQDDDAGLISTDDVMRLNTGWQQSPEHWRESAQRHQVLEKQNARMAEALERDGGIRTRAPFRVTAIGNATGEIDDQESYRAIRFLPLIAQRERRPILNALRYFQRHHPSGVHLRYAVVTAGRRVMAWGDLRGAMAHLHRQVSRWAHDADRDWGMEVLYRGTEFIGHHNRRDFDRPPPERGPSGGHLRQWSATVRPPLPTS